MNPHSLRYTQFTAVERLVSPLSVGTSSASKPCVLPANHSLHFRVHTRTLITLLVALAATAALWAEPPYRASLREAGEAQKAGNLPLAIEKLEAVRAMRPDYPRVLIALARAYTAAGQPDAALAALESAASRGIAGDVTKDPGLAALGGHPGFTRVARQLTDNATPRGVVATAQELPAQSGIIESAVVDSQGRWFFGDVRNRCIWTRSAEGALARFSAEKDALLGVFGLVIDEKRGALWAGVSAVPECRNYDAATEKGRACLAEFDLTTGAFRRSLQIPRAGGEHVLGSLRLGADGSLFATDSASPVIWRVAPGASQIEAWLESSDFGSLQGLAFSEDGATLFVADYANGIWSIDVATKHRELLRPADDTTLFGIDDLHLHRGALIGVQNGLVPARIIRVTLSGASARAETIAQGRPHMHDSATGAILDGNFHFIGDSGWTLHERAKEQPAPRDVHILAAPL